MANFKKLRNIIVRKGYEGDGRRLGSWTLYSDLKEKNFLLRLDIDSECTEATPTQEKNW